MKKLLTILVAAMFAATSFAALAQDKKGGSMDKSDKMQKSDKSQKSDKMAKKDGKKKDGKKKSADKMDKK